MKQFVLILVTVLATACSTRQATQASRKLAASATPGNDAKPVGVQVGAETMESVGGSGAQLLREVNGVLQRSADELRA